MARGYELERHGCIIQETGRGCTSDRGPETGMKASLSTGTEDEGEEDKEVESQTLRLRQEKISLRSGWGDFALD